MVDRAREVEVLFADHHDEIHRYLVRLTGDADLAADLAQETFIRWVEREPDRNNPRAWLFTVATNLARDHGRVGARRLTLLKGSDHAAAMGDAATGPDGVTEARQTRRLVREALDTLSHKERTLLLMQQEGFTHREIAAALDVNPKSVGVLLSRALKRFMKLAGTELESLR
jgi:RNA polymerase sigma factor (sigma-70 family)